MKSMSKTLLEKQQIEMYKMMLEITRQLMIPLGLILLAAVLFYYDETLIGYQIEKSSSMINITPEISKQIVHQMINTRPDIICQDGNVRANIELNQEKSIDDNVFVRFVA